MASETLKLEKNGQRRSKRRRRRRGARTTEGMLVDAELLERAARNLRLRNGRCGLDLLPED